MHTVKIRRPDSMMGSEDSDQPDFRLVVDSPNASKSVRFRSPTRSPRTTSLLLALGDIIQQEQEEEEWEEGESGEHESTSGEGSSEGRVSGEYEPADASTSLLDGQMDHPGAHPDDASEISARPTPIVGLSEDARRLLHCIPSPPKDHSPVLPESSLGDGSATLVDGISTRAGSPSGETTASDEDLDFTVTRFRRSVTPDHTSSPRQASHSAEVSPAQSIVVSEFTTSARTSIVLDPTPPSRRPTIDHNAQSSSGHASVVEGSQTPLRRISIVPDMQPLPRRASIHSSRHDSMSSGLLSPIEISSAPPISFPRYGSFIREDSLDSGYAEGPEPLRMSPPRTPTRRMSTLSILSSPFGSPSARMLFGTAFDPAAPSASALISPRFNSFPSSIADDARHSRDGSVDSFQVPEREEPSFTSSQFSDADEEDVNPGYDIQVEAPASVAPRPSSIITEVPEESSLFQVGSSSDYLGVGDDTLRIGDASFGSDDSMTSLYDQYYTPTVHSTNLENGPPAQEQVQEQAQVRGQEQVQEKVQIRDQDLEQGLVPIRDQELEQGLVPIRDQDLEQGQVQIRDQDMEQGQVWEQGQEQEQEQDHEQEQDQEQEPDQEGDSSPLDLSYLQETSPLTVVGAQMVSPDQLAESEVSLGYAVSPRDDEELEPPSSVASNSEHHEFAAPRPEENLHDTHFDSPAARRESVASSSAYGNRVFSPPNAYPASVASSGQIRNFSLPTSARNSLVFVAQSRSASPAASAPDDHAAEGSTRSASSLSSHGGERATSRQSVQSAGSSQSGSRKVPFGFRHSITDRSQLVARRRESVSLERPKPPPLVAVATVAEDDLPSRAPTPLSPVEETPMTASSTTSNPRRLKPLRLVGMLCSCISCWLTLRAVNDSEFVIVIARFFSSSIQHPITHHSHDCSIRSVSACLRGMS